MIEIIYKGGVHKYSIQGNVEIRGGMVATFSGNHEVRICDHRSIPVGFFLKDTNDPFLGYSSTSTVVGVGQAEYNTDLFEKGSYGMGDFLYCGSDGILTNHHRYYGNIILGIVNFVLDDIIGFVTCLARGLENPPATLSSVKSRYDIAKDK